MMHPTTTALLLAILLGVAAACAPHAPGCKKLKHLKKSKCQSGFGPGASCSEATIGKDGATCAVAGAMLVVDDEALFGATNKLYCHKGKWRFNEIDPVTKANKDGPVPGHNLNIGCVVLAPAG